MQVHPLKGDRNAFLFINTGNTNRCCQLRPAKLIRTACTDLAISKPVTCYSLKRNGITMRRLRGESDMEIQHAARWTSTKQLKTYDLSSQDDAFKKELEKRGLIPSTGPKAEIQRCAYCQKPAGFGETICDRCKRPLDRNKIVKTQKERQRETQDLRSQVAALQNQFESGLVSGGGLHFVKTKTDPTSLTRRLHNSRAIQRDPLSLWPLIARPIQNPSLQ